MDLASILADLCNKYPAFATKDAEVQVIPYTPTSVLFFYRDREFCYDTEVGILQILLSGTIQELCK